MRKRALIAAIRCHKRPEAHPLALVCAADLETLRRTSTKTVCEQYGTRVERASVCSLHALTPTEPEPEPEPEPDLATKVGHGHGHGLGLGLGLGLGHVYVDLWYC
jgi:hypothetical protein